ncbi:efflux transporter, RND family, MFP subunit [Methyloglobulus morosus KoM1]|uniref:Efflux transporter, RND family, MFP subunit n=1 Tax=Methyloglobulus morosus KoM1 TaxID=1116472 RepID=V5C5X5_9GAMM|nr:efflux RND transporter periplasmic adaptor subunit [Methyloglobulus morosus]ESS72143.1 efflux transporter, RND family, MFP subunit [Methyloglobulus morosus KoM1]
MATCNKFRLFKPLVFLFLFVSLLIGCSSQDQEVKLPPRPVKVFRVGNASKGNITSYAGEVRARFETALSFRVTGKILARPVEIGDRVHKGQLLAKLDTNDFRLSVESIKAQLKSAVADRDFTKDDLTRYRELLDQKVISNPDFDRHQTAYTNAQERVTALEAQLKQTINQLDYTELSADRDGVITALEVDKGQVIAAGQPVAKLAQLDEKEIHFDIPEQRISEIKNHQIVAVTLLSDNERKFNAKIREISASADPASRTYRAKAILLDGQGEAHLGMTATVWVASDNAERIAVPLSAVFTSQAQPKQQQVWLIDEATSTVKAVPVQLRTALPGELVSIEGLQAGQLIVSAGVQRLKESQAVRLSESLPLTLKNQGIESSGKQP